MKNDIRKVLDVLNRAPDRETDRWAMTRACRLSASRISAALDHLEAQGCVTLRTIPAKTRPQKIIRLIRNPKENAMTAESAPKHFNWDAYIHTTPYAEVAALGPGATPYPPTMTSPDGRWLYLAGQDIAVRTDDAEMLSRMLDETMDDLRTEIRRFNWSCRRVVKCELDYLAVWNALKNLDALPDDYRFPEYYLELAWRERQPVVRHTRDTLV